MGRLSSLRIVDPVLTNLAIGYSNAELVGDALMPFVYVHKEAGKLPKFGKEAFKDYQTERALRANSNRMAEDDPTGVPFSLTEHDLERAIDYREEDEAMFSPRRRATYLVQQIIRMRHERKVAAMVQNAANFPAANKIALSGTARFSQADSDPEGVIDDARAAISNGIAKDANTMVVAFDVWRRWKRHPKLKAILSDSKSRLVQLQDLREIFEIPNILIGKALTASDAGATSRLWTNSVVLAYVPTAMAATPRDGGMVDPAALRDVGEASFGYTFRKRGMPQVDIRPESGGKIELVRSTDIMDPYLLGADAGYLIQDAP
jgi:hypothetical protein